jgi:hypothetical protein
MIDRPDRRMHRRAITVALLGVVVAGGIGGCSAILGETDFSAAGPDASVADGKTADAFGTDGGDGGSDSGIVADKVDLLFVISNNAGMASAQGMLAIAVPQLLNRLTAPNCVDGSNTITGTAAPDGSCGHPGSTPEFPPVHDLHVGILSSSLGSRGGDVCPGDTTNPANPSLNAHNNDNGELINRGGVLSDPTIENVPGTPDAPSPLNFLSYFPDVPANASHPTPPTPPVTSATTLVNDFTTLVAGVHAHGCAYPGQNEAWYRFLVQPDPFATINVQNNLASLSGIDDTILQQRAAFLRPDSLLIVVVVSTKMDMVADPLTLEQQGWAFDQTSFPGSQSGGGAPEGTVQCWCGDPTHQTPCPNPSNPSTIDTTGPNDPNCGSCAFVPSSSPSFATECPNDGTSGNQGFLDPADDSPNLRFFHQKQRFGLITGYPPSRYVRGLQQPTVPSVGLAFPGDTDHEHDDAGNYVGDQDAQANCVNPIFAKNLPTSSAGQDLCHLEAGARPPGLVFYMTLSGVPYELLQQSPSDPMSLPKDTLTDQDWALLMGNDPEHYDFTGIDFHMVESETARTTNPGNWANASNCPVDAADDCDPSNGREFVNNKDDMQFSCIFPLVTVQSGTIVSTTLDCTQPQNANACACASTALDNASPLCARADGGLGFTTTQINGQAYPPVNELVIAHGMANEVVGGQTLNQGIVASICPAFLDVGKSLDQAGSDPLFAYNPGLGTLVNRIKPVLATSSGTGAE